MADLNPWPVDLSLSLSLSSELPSLNLREHLSRLNNVRVDLAIITAGRAKIKRSRVSQANENSTYAN